MSDGLRVVLAEPMRSASTMTAPRGRSSALGKPARQIYRRARPHGPPRGAVNDEPTIPWRGPGHQRDLPGAGAPQDLADRAGVALVVAGVDPEGDDAGGA